MNGHSKESISETNVHVSLVWLLTSVPRNMPLGKETETLGGNRILNLKSAFSSHSLLLTHLVAPGRGLWARLYLTASYSVVCLREGVSGISSLRDAKQADRAVSEEGTEVLREAEMNTDRLHSS